MASRPSHRHTKASISLILLLEENVTTLWGRAAVLTSAALLGKLLLFSGYHTSGLCVKGFRRITVARSIGGLKRAQSLHALQFWQLKTTGGSGLPETLDRGLRWALERSNGWLGDQRNHPPWQ